MEPMKIIRTHVLWPSSHSSRPARKVSPIGNLAHLGANSCDSLESTCNERPITDHIQRFWPLLILCRITLMPIGPQPFEPNQCRSTRYKSALSGVTIRRQTTQLIRVHFPVFGTGNMKRSRGPGSLKTRTSPLRSHEPRCRRIPKSDI
jgi:hypothetical protein